MRYSDLAGKEIIDIDQGLRLGVVNDTDLIINAATGHVESIVIPVRTGWWQRREVVIPWRGIRRIGVDLIIVDLAAAVEHLDHARPGGPETTRPAPGARGGGGLPGPSSSPSPSRREPIEPDR